MAIVREYATSKGTHIIIRDDAYVNQTKEQQQQRLKDIGEMVSRMLEAQYLRKELRE